MSVLDRRYMDAQRFARLWTTGRIGFWRGGLASLLIGVVAGSLRLYELGRLSFWYDEVVTMRLATAAGPVALVERLFEIDATRAPLHPLLLQAWIRVFGSSEAAARSLSVVCGLATIVLIYEIGRIAFDTETGVWASWLGAFSPLLIVYAREARMYGWLVFATCLCWRMLLGLREKHSTARGLAYLVSLTALVYSHPLGLIMMGALALAGLIDLEACFGGLKRWLAIHLGAIALCLPWLGNYLDHPPEFLTGTLSARFLLGTPIGFIGGNFLVMIGLILVIALGFARRGLVRDQEGNWRIVAKPRVAYAILLVWLIVPPVALYTYSWVAHPVFGPARYTVFVAPAYVILVASGLSQLPVWARYPLALSLTAISALALSSMVFAADLKADWRSFSAAIFKGLVDHPRDSVLVIVASAGQDRNFEVETARYYLPEHCAVLGSEEATSQRLERIDPTDVYFTVGSRQGRPVSSVPARLGPYQFQEDQRFAGLVVYRGRR
jgi:mannosyltransferase